MRTWQLCLAALCLTGPAAAAETAPPCSSPEHRQWDFWLGDWTVRGPAGKLAGTNRIVRSKAGCGIEEHWTSAGGGHGDSFNVYDPVRRTWTQLWAGADEVVRLEGRLDAAGAMRMEGTITNVSAANEHRFRGVWTPMPDGSVKQEFFEEDPRTGAWASWFVGIYRKEPAP